MPAISKFIPKIFASTGGADQIAKFGSLAANAPGFTTDPDEAQSLSNFLSGWFAAVIGGNSPCIEDMNAIFFVITSYMAYLNQQGVGQYDSDTEYQTDSIVTAQGILYISIQDTNAGKDPWDQPDWWSPIAQGFTIESISATGVVNEDYISEVDATLGNVIAELPVLNTVPKGFQKIVKCINTNANTVSVKAAVGEFIEGLNTYPTALRTNETLKLYKANDTTWRTL